MEKTPKERITDEAEMIYVVCWVEGNTRNWVEVSGKDAMWRKVSELNASGFDTPDDIVVGEITEDTE